MNQTEYQREAPYHLSAASWRVSVGEMVQVLGLVDCGTWLNGLQCASVLSLRPYLTNLCVTTKTHCHLIYSERQTFNWWIAFFTLACGHIYVAFSWLLIDIGEPIPLWIVPSVGSQPGLYKKGRKMWTRSKPASSILPWPLFQFLLSGPCLVFLDCLPWMITLSWELKYTFCSGFPGWFHSLGDEHTFAPSGWFWSGFYQTSINGARTVGIWGVSHQPPPASQSVFFLGKFFNSLQPPPYSVIVTFYQLPWK